MTSRECTLFLIVTSSQRVKVVESIIPQGLCMLTLILKLQKHGINRVAYVNVGYVCCIRLCCYFMTMNFLLLCVVASGLPAERRTQLSLLLSGALQCAVLHVSEVAVSLIN